MEIFWKSHDPTTLNRQGNDIGSQYRSVIYFHDDQQRIAAESYKVELNNAKIYDDPVVTEIAKYVGFYHADIEHQNYYNENQNQPYCGFVIKPKVEKIEQIFKEKIKTKLAG